MTQQYQQKSINLLGGNPNEVMIFVDDFLALAPTGNMGWVLGTTGTGAAIAGKWTSPDPEEISNHPGTVSMATAAGVGTVTLSQGPAAFPRGLVLECVLQILDLNDPGTDEHTVSFGYGVPADTNAINIFYDENSLNWQAQVKIAGTPTLLDTGVPVVAGQGYRISIESSVFENDGAGVVAFAIDGTAVGTIAGIPLETLDVVIGIARTFASVAAIEIGVDLVSMMQPVSR